jgi:hypothetical protein
MVAISPSGQSARNAALAAIAPVIADVVSKVGEDKVKAVLPVLREMRLKLSDVD